MLRMVLAAALIAGVAAAPARADKIVTSGETTPAAVEAAVEEAFRFAVRGDMTSGVARLDKLLATELSPLIRARVLALRGMMLIDDDKEREALRDFAEADRLAPNDDRIFFSSLQTISSGRPSVALPALDRMIAQAPGLLLFEDFREPVLAVLRWLYDKERHDDADARKLALARIGFGGDRLETRWYFAMDAARIAIERGDMATAEALAFSVPDRGMLTDALTDRRFEKLWPALAATAGPRMAAAEARAIDEAVKAAERGGQSVAARLELIRNLYLAGRIDEAEQLAAGFATTRAEVLELDEDGGWLVNQHAIILVALGRFDEADARMAAVMARDIESASWLISMAINRVGNLVRQGRWAQAAPLLDEIEAMAKTHGSPYARQLVRRHRICTLHGLDPQAGLAPLVAELMEHKKDARGATTDALICLGRMDEAEQVLLERLGDEKTAPDAVSEFQPPAAGPNPQPAVWTRGYAELLQRPAVKAAFDKAGRILPAEFWPAPREAKN